MDIATYIRDSNENMTSFNLIIGLDNYFLHLMEVVHMTYLWYS